MSLPLFYSPGYSPEQTSIELEEDVSKHVLQVLRMKEGDSLALTNGKGNWMSAEIKKALKKIAEVQVMSVQHIPPSPKKISLAVSLLKNASRFEWFLEKATEIGVTEIIPLICERTEKIKARTDRFRNILVSAMLQSQQAWLPELREPVSFKKVIPELAAEQKFVAHCLPGQQEILGRLIDRQSSTRMLLIGPEGDFTREEIEFAIAHQFIPASLGSTRLRTETAAIVGAVLLVMD